MSLKNVKTIFCLYGTTDDEGEPTLSLSNFPFRLHIGETFNVYHLYNLADDILHNGKYKIEMTRVVDVQHFIDVNGDYIISYDLQGF